MTGLAAWLLEQIAEDERLASAASPGPWKANDEHDEVWAVDGEPVADGFALSNNQLRATVDHMVSWDPPRVLTECDAKRQIIDLADEASGLDSQVDSEFRIGARDTEKEPYVGDMILKRLALPYGLAGRDGYREEWRP